MASRLVLALDETDPARALDIAKEVSPFVSKIKINYPLVLSAGLDIVTEISKFSKVICDFKVADIPNTNRLIAEAAFSAGASGIGWATAKVCLEKGAIVFICDIDKKYLSKAKKHKQNNKKLFVCLLYTSDAADE